MIQYSTRVKPLTLNYVSTVFSCNEIKDSKLNLEFKQQLLFPHFR